MLSTGSTQETSDGKNAGEDLKQSLVEVLLETLVMFLSRTLHSVLSTGSTWDTSWHD